MDCYAPPPLSDDQISSVLDGLAGPELLTHLAACAGCAARLASARTLERRVAARLYRWDCPPPDRLAEHERGRLGPEQSHAITAHLAVCVRCSRELADLRALLAADSPPEVLRPTPAPRLPAAAQRHSARQLPRQPGAALRGAGDGPIMAEADGATIFLDIQPGSPGQVLLQGQLVADDQASWAGALVELRQAGLLVATAFVDDLGSFWCPALPAGISELWITSVGGRRITLAGLDMRSAD